MPEIVINNFAGGLNLRESPDHINDNELQASLNYLLSQRGTLEPRLGYASINVQTGTPSDKTLKGAFVWQKQDATEWYVIRAGNQLYYKSGDAWVEIQIGGGNAFSTTGGDRTSAINYRGVLYLADGYNFIKWDGTTGSKVNVAGLDYILPYYLWVHDNRIWGGNLRMWNGSSYTAYPRSISWCQPQLDTAWTPPGDGSYNRIDFDYEVSGGVSFGHNVIFTARKIYLGIDDTALLSTYYFPSIKEYAPIGALPFTMQVCDSDVWFANEHGVYALSKSQVFGDLESNRLSYKIDPVFESMMAVPLVMNAIYVSWRDEYWLSYQSSEAGNPFKVLVGKRSLFDQWGRPPWMLLDISSRDWAIAPASQSIVFTAGSGEFYLWQYGGRTDRGTPGTESETVNYWNDTAPMLWNSDGTFKWTAPSSSPIYMYAQTKEYLSETRNRKRLIWITMHRKRDGDQTSNGLGQSHLQIYDQKTSLLIYDPVFNIEPGSSSRWSTITPLWGGFNWSGAVSDSQEVNSDKLRISKYARSFNVRFDHTSTNSGVAPMHFTIGYQESAR